MASKTETIFYVLEYLQSLKDDGANSDNIDTITSLLEEEFNVSVNPETFKEHSAYPVTLPDIIAAGKQSLNFQNYATAYEQAKNDPKFESFSQAVAERKYFEGTEEGSVEYLQRNAKLLSTFAKKVQPAGPSKAELEKQAEELKIKGNTAINSKDYENAVKFYTEAIELSTDGPNSHVYYSNRAAAYCHMNRYQDAVDDCHSSLALSPDYVKAFSRLGLANFFLERFQEAVEAYERALEIEPDNKATQESLRQARNKLKKAKSVTVPDAPSSSGAGAAGMPGGMAGLMNNPAMKKALDQVGGPAGLSSLMKDPQMMAMAQQMMKDPQMMQQAMSMLGGGAGGAGAGGMPDLASLAGLMGGMGGAGADPNTPPSSSSVPSSSSKKFKGFEE